MTKDINEERHTEVSHTTWRGIVIEITFERDWLGSPASDRHPSLPVVETLTPEHAALPINETGYHSHFLRGDAIDKAGGTVPYVLAWLDAAAQNKCRNQLQAAERQLALF